MNRLLEPSPYEVDEGNLIGRDPRVVTAEEYKSAGVVPRRVIKAIRAKCLDCCCDNATEVRKCVMADCPLWPFRMGVNPFYGSARQELEAGSLPSENSAET